MKGNNEQRTLKEAEVDREEEEAEQRHKEEDQQRTPFLISRMGVEKFLEKGSLVVTHVVRSLTDKAIADPSAHLQELHNEKNNEKDIYKYANCVCEKPKMERMEFYGKNDEPLGRFILEISKKATQTCRHCSRLRNKHELSFYHGLGRVTFKLDQQEYLSKLLQEPEAL